MATALDTFDPYREWLGIDPRELPADHYRLLGLPRFEASAARVAAAADERMGYVRRFQTGPRGPYTARLLNELSTAKLCLLSPASKAVYDAWLQAQLLASQRPGPAVQPWTSYGPIAVAPPVLEPPLAAPPKFNRASHVEPQPLLLAPPKADLEIVEQRPRPRTGAWIALGIVVAIALTVALAWSINKLQQQRAAAAAEAAQADAEALAAQSAAAKNVIVLLQESNGEISFSPATATTSGGLEVRPTGFEDLLVNWTGDAVAQWRFRLLRPGFFHAEITYSTPESFAGAQLEVQVGDQAKKCDLRPSGGQEKFISDTFTIALTSSGDNVLKVRSLTPNANAAVNLKLIRIMPVGGESGL